MSAVIAQSIEIINRHTAPRVYADLEIVCLVIPQAAGVQPHCGIKRDAEVDTSDDDDGGGGGEREDGLMQAIMGRERGAWLQANDARQERRRRAHVADDADVECAIL